MNAPGGPCCILALVCASIALPDEPVRILCDPADPANACPGPRCRCAPDGLEVEFRGPGASTFTYDEFREGMEVEMSVVLAAESPGIQGFAFGVAHDPRDLEILFADTGPDLAGFFECEVCPGNWPIVFLQHLFARGPALPTPGLECGADATADDLGCEESICP